MDWRIWAAPLALSALASCRSAWEDPYRPSEWLELGAGVHDLEEDGPVDDAAGLFLGGGVDFWRGPARAGLEISAAFAQHDLASISTQVNPHVDVGSYSVGGRFSADLPGTRVGLYARGGWTWRDEGDHGAGFANDQWGTYVGAGIEWWFAPWGSLGPFIQRFRGEDDGLEETRFGLATRFYFPREW